MPDENAERDENRVPSLLAVDNATQLLTVKLRADASGRLIVLAAGTGTGQYAEDSAHTTADIGNFILGVRNDAPAALTGTDLDYSPIAVDSSGRVQVGATVPGTGATNLGKAVDSVPGATDTGVVNLVVRDDALAALTPVDGDYTVLRVNANGALWAQLVANSGIDVGDVDVTSVIPGTGATNLGKAVDAAPGATDTGVVALVLRDDALAALTPVDGDYTHLRVNANGALWAQLVANSGIDIGDVDVTSIVSGTGATNLGKAKDAVAGATDTGIATLALRDDALSAITPAEGDYSTMTLDANGALWVHAAAGTEAFGKLSANSGVDIGDVDVTSVIPGTGATNLGKAQDSVLGATDTGVAILSVRDDALSAITPVEGDYAVTRLDANGALWVHAAAGTEAFGKLSANSGVDIGDVDVTSIIPGTGATNLGKAEDAAHVSGDTGAMLLGVRNDTASTAGSGTNGDYTFIATTANGQLFLAPSGGSVGVWSSAASAAYEASRVVKASAGRLRLLTGYNSGPAQWIQLHDANVVPAETSVPALILRVPTAENFSYDPGELGRYFATGITVLNSTTGPTKTIGAADCWFNAEYL